MYYVICYKKSSQDIRPVNLTKDMLDIIGYLFNNGANPTVKCNVDWTPRDFATQSNFKLGAALFGNLNYINLSLVLSKLYFRNFGTYLVKGECQ